MVWAVSLSTMKLSPHCLTCMQSVLAFGVWLGLVTRKRPLAHSVLYLQDSSQSCSCTSIHFGENQLSPCSIGISPLSTSHPPVLQHWWVRASTDCHIRFTLLMDSSHGFGSHRRNGRLIQTRLLCGSPTIPLVNQATTMHSPDHSTKGTPLALGLARDSGL